MDNINFISIMTIAFLGSFGHCIGMCGGIVIAYSSTKLDEFSTKQKQASSHIIYSLGRVSTYVILGAIFGYLGSFFSVNSTSRGILFFVAGIFMVLTAFSLLGKIKFLTYIEHSIMKSAWYQKTFKKFLKKQNLLSFYTLGLLNGLLPCGFVYFFAVTAASTASIIDGALVMFIFGMSTIPALFSLGFFISILKQSNLRDIMIKLAAISVLVYGIITIYKGYNFILNPKKSTMMKHH